MGFEDIFYNSEIGQYTITGTVVYSVILILMVWIIYTKILQRKNFKIDEKFLLAFLTFMIFGGLGRAAADVVLLSPTPNYIKFFIVTPGIYFTVTGLALLTLFISSKLENSKGIPYHKTMLWIGGVLSAIVLTYLFPFVTNFTGMGLILLIFIIWGIVLYPITKKFSNYLTKENYYVLMSHMLDASATFVGLGLTFGLGEKHVLPNLLIFDLGFGPIVMFALKLAIVWPALYYIDKKTDDRKYRIVLKTIIILLGLSLGVRDLFAVGIFGTPIF